MMSSPVSPQALENYCNTLLQAERYRDYCPNGLQIEGKPEIRRLVGGVTACQALIDAAIEAEADAILVHHGYFWKGEPEPLTGMKGRRIKTLLQNDVSLLAYHLPLDGHPELGNNASLIKKLGLEGDITHGTPDNLLSTVTLNTSVSGEVLGQRLYNCLARVPLWIDGGPASIQKIALCTGAAQSMIAEAARLGCDAFISGELSERTVHEARELGIHYFAAGHHATETGGVQQLGQQIARELGINFQFIDIDNPA